jgi:histidine triad (HIT) family protein
MNVPPEQSLFQKIIDKQIPADIVYEDDRVLAFRDISPQAPTHILLISKIAKIGQVIDTDPKDDKTAQELGYLMLVAGTVAQKVNVANRGFRLVVNQGEHAGQMVNYLHIHLLAGRQLTWPPG